ncbi:adhesion G protein-coupled receptor E2-like [Acanthaster planci]|uniref:Adhesion G protein-coupled receptor E2-like n=1 Tax=Acanthaster planci TaxID=133434 RepID=A0A8B7ZA58_ACAPL|nr:adhesion G protein-coupled receptor E2-like [Acanthaster planci]
MTRDLVFDYATSILEIAKKIARAWPEGSSMHMHQDDRDVFLRNRDGLTKLEKDVLSNTNAFMHFDQKVVTPPIVLVESTSGEFLGYSAEFDFTTDYEYSEFASERTLNFNATSDVQIEELINKDILLRYSVPSADLSSSRGVNVSRREELMIKEGDNFTIVWASSTAACTSISDTHTRTSCKIVHYEGWSSPCECSHVDDVTVFIKVWKIGISRVFRWSLSLSCGVSVIAIIIALVLRGYARCLWKTDTDLATTMVLVAIAMTDISLLLSVQDIKSEIFCRANGIALHFFYTSVCSWMFVRGLLLHRQSHEPLQIATGSLPHQRISFLIGLGIPSVVVFVSTIALFSQYTSELGCVADFKKNLLWAFLVAPILITTLVLGLFLYVVKSVSINKMSALNTKEMKRNLFKSACLAVLTSVALILMPPSLASPTGKLTAAQWIFAVINSLQGLCMLSLCCFWDSKVRKALAHRVGQSRTPDEKLKMSTHKVKSPKSSPTTEMPVGRGASYIEADFTPVVPGPGALHHGHDSPTISMENDGFEDCPEIDLRVLSPSPTPDPTMRPVSAMSDLTLQDLPGMVFTNESEFVREVKTTHRVFVKGKWHVEQDEKVIRKVYRRPRSNAETSTV